MGVPLTMRLPASESESPKLKMAVYDFLLLVLAAAQVAGSAATSAATSRRRSTPRRRCGAWATAIAGVGSRQLPGPTRMCGKREERE